MLYILGVLYVVFTVAGLILLKLGTSGFSIKIALTSLNMSLPLFFILGFCSYVISFLVWIAILQRVSLNYMFPVLTGLAYIFVLLASFFILKEHISVMRFVGAMIIITGIVIMNVFK